MSSALLDSLVARARLPVVDETSVDAFLAPAAGEAKHALLFFAGDPAQRPESGDVAVILPELLQVFAGRLRAALVSPEAEAALKPRFQVYALPSLVVTRDGNPVAVLPKIYDWSDYLQRIEAALAPDAPVIAAAKRPAVEISHSHNGGVA